MFNIERDWITSAGFRAVVIMTNMGTRCGYVGLPKGHPLHGHSYNVASKHLRFPENETIGKRGIMAVFCAAMSDKREATPDIVFDVHGGITYSGASGEYPVESSLWWFGYDCAHAGDGKDFDVMEAMNPKSMEFYIKYPQYKNNHARSLDYCVAECESLAQQMQDRVIRWPWMYRVIEWFRGLFGGGK